MRVLFIKDVSGTARAGEVKDVSDGHARNFLIPRGLAAPATDSLVNKLRKESKEKQDKSEREKEKLKELAKKLGKVKLVIKARAGKEHLFAAVHEEEIAKAIKDKSGVEINPDLIEIPTPIKSLGLTQIIIKVSPEHRATVQLEIQPQ